MVRLQRFLKESNILQTFNICLSRSEEKCTPDLQALHVCLAHWYFDFSENLPHVAFCYFPISQIVAYSRPMDFPIFFDNGHLSASIVNMQAVLHMINFWRYHMQEPVRNLCLGLNSKEKPQGWKRPVFDAFACVKGLSRMWKGAYGKSQLCPHILVYRLMMASAAYMSDPHDVDELRASSDDLDNVPIERMMYFDEIDEAGLQNIEFDFAEDHNIAGWPKAFEDNLQAIPSISLYTYNRYVTQRDTVEVKGTAEEKKPTDGPINGTRHISKRKRRPLSTTTSIPPLNDTQNSAAIKKLNSATSPEIVGPRKGKDYLPFSGSISDLSGYQGISGILHNLPDQSGIPGFQRISFMKYAINIPKQQDEVTPWASEDHHDQIDEDYYCYQGVVLPGGHIILGRWWAPFDDEEQYCTGPFMLWAVEE